MSPPAPIPEREFEEFLKEHGCYGKRNKKEYAAYRISDDRLVSTYAVRHGKAEVKYPYKVSFLRALKEIEMNEKSASTEQQSKRGKTVGKQRNQKEATAAKLNTWQNAKWYEEQRAREKACGMSQEAQEKSDD